MQKYENFCHAPFRSGYTTCNNITTIYTCPSDKFLYSYQLHTSIGIDLVRKKDADHLTLCRASVNLSFHMESKRAHEGQTLSEGVQEKIIFNLMLQAVVPTVPQYLTDVFEHEPRYW